MVKHPLVKPRMVYAIDHESGVAWDLQWCPLVTELPKSNGRKELLGVLAVCFGDGSLRIFEVSAIPEERLQAQPSKDSMCVVEKNIPVVIARLSRILQLSVQWSPFHWNMLLTGGSDGSVSLWNIKTEISGRRSSKSERTEPEPIEPQMRFQDADTIGKQEAFDWGCGWVAIRAVAWSPFDEHLFATTGNDSVFKVWDIREPRSCLRSHRIRSTWGLSLQWMDQTSIQISGDQGSIYMYDILSGSYQKLHFHPQIDSPVWDLQFGRRGAAPLLVSSVSDDEMEEEETGAPESNPEEARLMTEYQLDLSEEDAFLLAIQMSQADTATPTAAVEANNDAGSSSFSLTQEPQKSNGSIRQNSKPSSAVKTKARTKAKEKTEPNAQTKAKAKGKAAKGKKHALPSKVAIEEVAESGVTEDAEDIEAEPAITKNADESGKDIPVASSTTTARKTKQAAPRVSDIPSETSGGLKNSGWSDGKCKGSSLGPQVYVRSAWYRNLWAIMYSWYFPKNPAGLMYGHRHDWANVVVWSNNPAVTNPTSVAVCPSSSGLDNYFYYQPPPAEVFDGVATKLRYYCIIINGGYHSLDTTKKNGGGFQGLIMWEQLTDAARAALDSTDFGVEAPVPFIDINFEANLKLA
ncbi:hypothetical protein BBJ29_004322 [Phytophthora kernoviae]|uniref:Histone-binding protein RBBP4 N-terminal domain-containing protein n=1 Tax=Phytophthora kernoviae TaxID=325452 RepID=A0A3R7HLP8_9STRA|nr:hypothetical protein BBJ29_004322 [Phytophthora kernoviae]